MGTTSTSNAAALAQAVALVAVKVARTGLDVANISVNRSHSPGSPVGEVDVQALSEDDALAIACIFPGLPTTPHYHGGNVQHSGTWVTRGIRVTIYAAANVVVTA